MNRFPIQKGKADEFENVWKTRKSYLDDVPGFISFKLLRSEDEIFISHSTWENKESFVNWTESESFRKAHSEGPSVKNLLAGPPEFKGYEVVLEK